MRGKGKVIITGRLGEVMKESALAALTWIRSNAAALGLEPRIFEESDFHIHIPAGAIPKDGPSAGITLACSLVSLLTDLPVASALAMTGEVTLRGKVLPVGGIKEKVIAAKSAGIEHVILPSKNEKDLEDVAEPVRRALTFSFVDELDQVLELAFGERLAERSAAERKRIETSKSSSQGEDGPLAKVVVVEDESEVGEGSTTVI